MDTNNNQQEKGIISIKRNSDQLDSANHANQAGPTSDVVQCVLFPTCRKTFKGMSYMWQHAHYRHGIDQHAYETMVERRDTNFTQSTSTQALLEQVQKEQEIHFGQEKKVTQHPPTHGFSWRGTISTCSICEERIPTSCWEFHAALHQDLTDDRRE